MDNVETLPVEWAESIRGLRLIVLIDSDTGELLPEQLPTTPASPGPTYDYDW